MARNSTSTTLLRDAAQVRRILRQVDPTLLKEVDKANREAAKPILAYAKSLVPSRAPISGWQHNGRTGWDSVKVAKGMVMRAGKRSSFSDYRSLLEFRQNNTAGAIFEVLGRRKTPRTEQGRRFLDVIQNRYPRTSRLLWRAVDDMGLERLQDEIRKNYERAYVSINRKLK